jgi:hypothetical protein
LPRLFALLLRQAEATGPDFPMNGLVALLAADDGTWTEEWRFS